MLWTLLIVLGLVKLIVASMMLWLPFRYDSAMSATEDPPRSDSDEDGGSKVPGSGFPDRHPRRPLPRLPRRGGPHGAPSSVSPTRVRALIVDARTRRSRVSR
jgi:hypothetical protein